MSKVCILSIRDHRRHVVIQRLINTLLENGFNLSIVDQGEKAVTENSMRYKYLPVIRHEWLFLVTNTWRLIRRIPSMPLHNQFWKGVLWLRTLTNAGRMAQVALHEKPDYYIGCDLQSTWAAMLASKFHRCPVIYWADELESEQGDSTPTRRLFLRSLEQKLIPQVDHLIVPNHSRAELYLQRYVMQTEPTIVQNCPPSSPVIQSNKLREKLGLPDSVHIVLYHGALIRYRSLDKLIESAGYFGSNTVLVLIGEQGSYFKETLEPLYEANELHNRVFFLAYVPPAEIIDYVASADLGIVIYENVNLNNYLCAPTKLYEFIMMKVPVAACNFPELVELFEHYPVGVTFDPENPKSIAQAINSFFAKHADERSVMDSVLEQARQHFTWENESLKWLSLLKNKQKDNFVAISQSDKFA
jgi:glycosyltransferase involved in cell wall biosynthesis